MREIKFRYRLKELTKKGYREWFEYFTIQDLERGAGITTAEIIARDLYTGFLDKNGIEIYENDIVKYNPTLSHIDIVDKRNRYEEILDEIKIGKVKWDVCFWAVNGLMTINKNYEVIGNIHETQTAVCKK